MKNNFELLKERVYNSNVFQTIEITDLILDRVNYELGVIQKLGFEDYFLLYSRITEVCNELNLLRTYGRGNAVGSFINFCLDITKINPLEENLIFERFINPELNIFPDIDIDIPNDTRKIIVERLKEKYPEYNTYFVVIPSINSKNIIDTEPGSLRYVQHCCGVIISNEKLKNNTFFYNGEEYIKLTPGEDALYDKRVDFVGQEYLKRIQLIVNIIGAEHHPYKIPLNDENVFDVFHSGETENIFHFFPSDLKEILKAFRPKSIRDLSVINAMYRPRAIDDLPNLIECKQNRISYAWSDNRVADILSETYGWMVYQETYYLLFNEIAGISFSEIDIWRKRRYKDKEKNELKKFNEAFISGCRSNSTLHEQDIQKLWNLINSSFKVLFLKAHSISYSTVAYWGAYYKRYFRKTFDEAFKNYLKSNDSTFM